MGGAQKRSVGAFDGAGATKWSTGVGFSKVPPRCLYFHPLRDGRTCPGLEAVEGGVEDLVGGDPMHEGDAGGVLVVEDVGGRDVLDGVVGSAIRADEREAGGAEQADDGSVEADGDVERGGVVGDDEAGALDDGHEQPDGGGPHAVDDAGVGASQVEQWSDVAPFGIGADEDDVVAAGGEAAGDVGEAIGGPLLGGPAAGGGEDDIGRGERGVLVDSGAVFGGRVEAQVGDGGYAHLSEKVEDAIDGVRVAGHGVGFGQAQPATLAGVGKADPAGGARNPREEARAGQPLQVDGQVVAACREVAEPAPDGGPASRREPFAHAASREVDQTREVGVGAEGVGEGVLDEPVDAGARIGPPETDQRGNGSADVAQRAGAHDEDVPGLVVHGGRWYRERVG